MKTILRRQPEKKERGDGVMDSVHECGLSAVSVDHYLSKVLLLRESQLFHSGLLLVLLIYTLNAALA